MGPKKSGMDKAGAGHGLPTHASAVSGIVKLCFSMTDDGPGDKMKNLSSSALGWGRKNVPWFKIILHKVREDPDEKNAVVLTPTGKAAETDELSVVFLGDYALAAQHIGKGHRLKVVNFVVGRHLECDDLEFFKFDLVADGGDKDPNRQFLWEFQDKDGRWQVAYRMGRPPGQGELMIKDSNLRDAIGHQDEIKDYIQKHEGKKDDGPGPQGPKGGSYKLSAMRHEANPSYTKLKDIKVDPYTLWSVYAVISDYRQPRYTGGKDMVMTMTLVDESRPEGLRCSFLLKEAKMPMIRRVGDVIRVHRFKCGTYPQDSTDQQGQADFGTGITLISCDKPVRRGPVDDGDKEVQSGGVYFQGDSKVAIDDDALDRLRAFSKKFFADPLASGTVAAEQYSKKIATLPSLNVSFDLFCQVVDYTGTKDWDADFVKLEVRDGTDLPAVPPEAFRVEQLRRGQGVNLLVGSVLSIHIHRTSGLLNRLLEPINAPGRPGRWAWVKIRNVALKAVVLRAGAREEYLYVVDDRLGCFTELPAFHHRVREMLRQQDDRIEAEHGAKAPSSSSPSSQAQSSSQAGKAKGKRAASSQEGGGPSKKGTGDAKKGGLEGRASESITGGTKISQYVAFTPLSVVLKETKENPVNKFRVCVQLADVPGVGGKTKPAEAGQMVKFSKLSDKWTGSVSLCFEDSTAQLGVTALGADFEEFLGVKCSDCESPQGLKKLEGRVKALTAQGAVLDVFIKSYPKPSTGEVVFLVYDTRLK